LRAELFVNFDDNDQLDAKGKDRPVPFGRVVSGMATLDSVFSGYRERPKPTAIKARGDGYLRADFPKLSRIIRARQVAFVEEPFALSKNETGLLITLLMVACACGCCALTRGLRRRVVQRYKDDGVALGPDGDDDDDDDDDGEGEGEDEGEGGGDGEGDENEEEAAVEDGLPRAKE
jgi:hypothetical protein